MQVLSMKKYISIQSYWSNYDRSNKSQKTSTSSTPIIDQEIEDINHDAFCFVCYLFKDITKNVNYGIFEQAIFGQNTLRNDGWENFLNRVISFYKNHEIEMFLSVIDLQIQELNNRFDEVKYGIIYLHGFFESANSFATFDKQKILRLAEFYPHDFTKVDLLEHEFQLEMYIVDVRNDARFQQVKDLGGLSCMLIETNKHKTFPYVYLLLKLVLILPVATTSVERVFSAMSFVKSRLRNNMGDQLLNDSLVTFIEKDIFLQVSDESVLCRFQNMKI
uniref:HAT C-terminal dimerisation domain-containing protein n=1 Tax=Kalanchoe fedtschenkoi TaxID=63787 RepID=A0A7N0RBZ8_KALFE